VKLRNGQETERYRDERAAPDVQIDGTCDARFEAVREAFRANFEQHDELGAALAVVLEGRAVVDLWGGWANRTKTRPWRRDTLVNVFSVGKAMASICVMRLVERGALDLDAPVAKVWPEFAAAGKEAATLRQLLSHQAGLPAIREPLPPGAMLDWPRMIDALAATEPWWEPGTRHGYHPNTYGFLVGELVRRASGERIGRYFRDEFARPLDLDFHFGVGSLADSRIAEYVHLLETTHGMPLRWEGPDRASLTSEQQEMILKAHNNPPGFSGNGMVNRRDWREAEIPSTGAHGHARAVARFYGALTGEAPALAVETLERWTREECRGPDAVVGRSSRFGLGVQLTQEERPLGPHPRSFGHFGAGGALGFADPDTGLGFGYVMNRMRPGWRNPKNLGLLEALYACL
jgi:CubicO group peptidase (beta-lactamase class C family)